MNVISRLILIFLLPGIACVKVSSQQSASNDYINFEEFRPNFPVFSYDSLIADNSDREDTVYLLNNGMFNKNMAFEDSLVQLMDTLASLNNSIPFWGYRIVLYTGSDRQEAIFRRGKALKILADEDTKVYMNYQRPYFKVRLGNYYNRITAYPSFIRIKNEFPTALLVPDIIDLKEIQFR